MSHHYLILLLALCIPATALAETIVYDHFNDGVLDPAWEVVLNEFACGWTYTEEASELRVTEICNSGNATDWATVSLSQPCLTPADFHLEWRFAWDSHGLPDTMQELILALYDESGEWIALVGYIDAWVLYGGKQYAAVRDEGNYTSGYGIVSWADTAAVTVDRVGETITFKWNDETIFEAPNATPVASIAIRFYYTWYGSPSTAIDASVDRIWITDSVTAAAPDPIATAGPVLVGNSPNPFNPHTTIHFELSNGSPVLVQIFDLRGRMVATLVDEALGGGHHSVTWNGRDEQDREVPSGVYLCNLKAGGQVAQGRMVLVR